MKNFVLDTNILLSNPDCIMDGFDDNNLIIPLVVIEELDNIKKEDSERGKYARESLKNIENIREGRNIKEGFVRNDKGGNLKVVLLSEQDIRKYNLVNLDTTKKDNFIILTAAKLQKEDEKIKTMIISNDVALRIKSTLLDVLSEHYKEISISDKYLDYRGFRDLVLPLEFFGSYEESTGWKPDETREVIFLEEVGLSDNKDSYPNEFFLVKCEENDLLNKKEIKQTKNVYILKNGELHLIDLTFKGLYGNITGKNLEQSLALSLLMNDDIKIITMTGPAGSGKTLLASSICATKLLKDKNTRYEKIILIKPTVQIMNDMGFLPGTLQEKISPYNKSFLDNFDFLRKREMCHTKTSKSDTFDDLIEKGLIETECISFIRGRSLSDSLIILDEAQNLDRKVIKTVISRVGENSRIIILGDLSQIDTPHINRGNSGLSHLMKNFKGQDIYGHITFTQGVRSLVSSLAAELL